MHITFASTDIIAKKSMPVARSFSARLPTNTAMIAIFADRKYKECLSQSRAGINMTRHELHQKDMVITPLIFQGQSPYQIITNHPELDISVRTLYSYLDKGILSARNIDLKRQVKFKPPQSTQDPDQRQIRFYQTYVF